MSTLPVVQSRLKTHNKNMNAKFEKELGCDILCCAQRKPGLVGFEDITDVPEILFYLLQYAVTGHAMMQ